MMVKKNAALYTWLYLIKNAAVEPAALILYKTRNAI